MHMQGRHVTAQIVIVTLTCHALLLSLCVPLWRRHCYISCLCVLDFPRFLGSVLLSQGRLTGPLVCTSDFCRLLPASTFELHAR